MTPTGFAFLGLTAILAALSALLTFAVLKIMSAARDTRSHLRDSGAELTAGHKDAAMERLQRLASNTSGDQIRDQAQSF